MSPLPEFDVYQQLLIVLWLGFLAVIICYAMRMSLVTLLLIILVVLLVLGVLGSRGRW